MNESLALASSLGSLIVKILLQQILMLTDISTDLSSAEKKNAKLYSVRKPPIFLLESW